jgi:hypothetical protein
LLLALDALTLEELASDLALPLLEEALRRLGSV